MKRRSSQSHLVFYAFAAMAAFFASYGVGRGEGSSLHREAALQSRLHASWAGFNAEGSLIVFSGSAQTAKVALYDPDTGRIRLQRRVAGDLASVSDDGSLIVCGSRHGTATVLDARTLKIVRRIKTQPMTAAPEADALRGQLIASELAGHGRGALGLYYLSSGRLRRRIALAGSCDNFAFNPSAGLVLCDEGGRADIVSVPSGKTIITSLKDIEINALASIAASANFIAGGTDKGHTPLLAMVDGRTGRVVRRFAVTGLPIAAAVSPDGLTMAEFDGAYDEWMHAKGPQLLRIFDVRSGRLRAVQTYTVPVSGLIFAPNGRRLAALQNDGRITVWRTPGTR